MLCSLFNNLIIIKNNFIILNIFLCGIPNLYQIIYLIKVINKETMLQYIYFSLFFCNCRKLVQILIKDTVLPYKVMDVQYINLLQLIIIINDRNVYSSINNEYYAIALLTLFDYKVTFKKLFLLKMIRDCVQKLLDPVIR